MYQRIITVRGIVLRGGEILCVRQKHDGGVNDFWCVPGGKMDPGESIVECLDREMIEEIGVEPQIGRLVATQQYAEKDCEFLEFFFAIENAADYKNIDLAKTTHGNLEIAEFDFVDPKSVSILPEFLREIDVAKIVRGAAPVHIANYLK